MVRLSLVRRSLLTTFVLMSMLFSDVLLATDRGQVVIPMLRINVLLITDREQVVISELRSIVLPVTDRG